MKEELLTALSMLNRLGKMETEIEQSELPKNQLEINYIVLKIRTDEDIPRNNLRRIELIKNALKLFGKLSTILLDDLTTIIDVIPATDYADQQLKSGVFTKKQF